MWLKNKPEAEKNLTMILCDETLGKSFPNPFLRMNTAKLLVTLETLLFPFLNTVYG